MSHLDELVENLSYEDKERWSEFKEFNSNKSYAKLMAKWVGAVAVIVYALSWPLGYANTKYSVWQSHMVGEQALAKSSLLGQAELKKADWNRQIAVREAFAKAGAAVELAKAEVIRAKGVAKANKIIGQSLNHNESYLTYLYINNLEHTKNQIIYVPTEAGLPILEANRLNHR